jgi:hypothetical protein
MALPTVLQNVLDRLHAGYPKGIPDRRSKDLLDRVHVEGY